MQWGGERLCEGQTFATDDGKAHFVAVAPREVEIPAGRFLLSTRRGKQFNSMVFKATDPLTGAGRDALFVSAGDAARLGIGEGDRVAVRSETGEVAARVRVSAIREGNVQMFWPEANQLIAGGSRDTASLVPDYNAVVTIDRA